MAASVALSSDPTPLLGKDARGTSAGWVLVVNGGANGMEWIATHRVVRFPYGARSSPLQARTHPVVNLNSPRNVEKEWGKNDTR